MGRAFFTYWKYGWLLLCFLLVALAAPAQNEVTPVNGDVNSDNEVNIADVNSLIDIIFDGGTYSAAADVNHDDEINIADVNAVIGLILDEQASHIETFTVGGVTFSMVDAEGGTFMSRHSPQVTLSPFAIGQTEVTVGLWKVVMGYCPIPSLYPEHNHDPRLPAQLVSWDDWQEFITKLNEMTGRTFRLPTEAEWEFAARGGNYSHGYKYAGSDNLDEVAWYEENWEGSNGPFVRMKAPNELGLYDMSGFIWEWCQDWFGPYRSEPLVNPVGPESGNERVIRGGCYPSANYCRVSSRNSNAPDERLRIGLRLVMDADTSAP